VTCRSSALGALVGESLSTLLNGAQADGFLPSLARPPAVRFEQPPGAAVYGCVRVLTIAVVAVTVAVGDTSSPSLPRPASLSPGSVVSGSAHQTELAQTVGRAFHTAGRASLQELRIHRRSPSARITTQPLGGGYVEGQSRQDHHRCSGRSRRAGSRARRQPGCGQRRDHAHDPGDVPGRDDDSGPCWVRKHGGDALAVR